MYQLTGTHLQREQGHTGWLAGVHGSIACQVKGESGFTHGRPRSQDDKIRILPAIGHFIELGKSTGNTGYIFVLMPHIFDTLNGFYQHRIDGIEVFTQVIVGNLKEFSFGIIQQIKNVCRVFVSITDDLTADTYEFTLNEFLQNDTCVCFNVGSRYHCIGELGDIIGTAYYIQLFAAAQLFCNSEDIDGLAFIGQSLHGTEDTLMRLHIKTLGL